MGLCDISEVLYNTVLIFKHSLTPLNPYAVHSLARALLCLQSHLRCACWARRGFSSSGGCWAALQGLCLGKRKVVFPRQSSGRAEKGHLCQVQLGASQGNWNTGLWLPKALFWLHGPSAAVLCWVWAWQPRGGAGGLGDSCLWTVPWIGILQQPTQLCLSR